MTDLLALVPALQRQLRIYTNSSDTGPHFAAYLADAVQALMLRWDRTYTVEQTGELTFSVTPDIAQADYRPIILMASIIYKSALGSGIASYTDGDFSYVPMRGTNPIEADRKELLAYLGDKPRLVAAQSAPLRGYAYVMNKESYTIFLSGGWITDGLI